MRATTMIPFAVVAAAGAAVFVVYKVADDQLRERSEALASELRKVDEEALKAGGQLVLERKNRVELERQLAAMTEANRELAEALAKAQKAATKARPVAVLATTTGPQPASGETRPARAEACLLAPGDTGEITLDEVVLETEHGAQTVVGAMSAWRVSPEPRTRLFGSPFSVQPSVAERLEEREPDMPSWELGPAVGIAGIGAALGVVVTAPAISVFGLEARPGITLEIGWRGPQASIFALWAP